MERNGEWTRELRRQYLTICRLRDKYYDIAESRALKNMERFDGVISKYCAERFIRGDRYGQ
jgi:hypothetical protein